MIPSSFCFWWVNGAVASVYTIHEPFEHCLLQLGSWNILLVCPLFPFNSDTLILQNLLKRLWLKPLFNLCLCFEVFRLHLSFHGWGLPASYGWIRGISMDCQAARLPMNYLRISRPVMGLIVDALTCSKISKYKHIYIYIQWINIY